MRLKRAVNLLCAAVIGLAVGLATADAALACDKPPKPSPCATSCQHTRPPCPVQPVCCCKKGCTCTCPPSVTTPSATTPPVTTPSATTPAATTPPASTSESTALVTLPEQTLVATSLPVTGASTWFLVVTAIGIIVAGAVLFLMARRRRVNFTAE